VVAQARHFDVVIVGARCAGAPLATLLARAGLEVAVIDQARLPSDTLSSHVQQADALAFLARLGVIEQVKRTGAPLIGRLESRLEDFRFVADYPQRPGDVGGAVCVRRRLLDEILLETALDAGAEVRTATKVTGLLGDRGRRSGVRIVCDGRESELSARLVVGADGRSSTVARLVGARRYNITPNARAYYWTYFEGAQPGPTPSFIFHRWGDRFVIAAPADSGLYMVGVSPEMSERDEFRRDLDGSLMGHALSCEPVADVLAGARQATKVFGIVRFDGYFREPSGPGWVLVGDAGHFKDPAAGRGIGDAFLQIERLALTILSGLDASSDAALDAAIARWGRWRDAEFAEHYWLGTDLGRAGAIPTMLPELARRLYARGKMDHFLDLLSHRARPSEVLTVSRTLEATGRLLPRPHVDRRALLGEMGELMRSEARRRWVNRYPVFDAPAA
jgi:flavin-dependent dehydrogenase